MASKTTIHLSLKDIRSIDLKSLANHLSWVPQHVAFFQDDEGKEPYKLLACMSKQLPSGSVMSDIGTLYGCSALAMSINETVHVNTYDVVKVIPDVDGLQSILTRPNVSMTVVSAQAVISKIATSDIISLDMNTVDGQEEIKIIQHLFELGFRGVLVIDDIHVNDVMKKVWNYVPSTVKKIDVTHYGHWSGTGIVVYAPTYIDVLVS